MVSVHLPWPRYDLPLIFILIYRNLSQVPCKSSIGCNQKRKERRGFESHCLLHLQGINWIYTALYCLLFLLYGTCTAHVRHIYGTCLKLTRLITNCLHVVPDPRRFEGTCTGIFLRCSRASKLTDHRNMTMRWRICIKKFIIK